MVVYNGTVVRLLSNSSGVEGENGSNALKGLIAAGVPLVVADEQRGSPMASF